MPGFLPPELWALLLGLVVVAFVFVTQRRRRRIDDGTRVSDPPPRPSHPLLTLRDVASDAPPRPSRPLRTPCDPSASAPILVSPTKPRVVLRRPQGTRLPLLLVHGWFGWTKIELARLRHEYFRGIPSRLEALGHRVHVARVSPTAGIKVRAQQLARQIDRLGPGPVNIIAHSMGGLDARLAIAHLGMGSRVATLTTIGTPHHGTPLADMAMDFGEWRRVRRMLDAIGANVDGLYDLSTRHMRRFNERIQDSPTVVYSSVVGAVGPDASTLNAVLALGHQYLLSRAGPNDGIVPAWSQRWGETTLEIEADHWAQIGWGEQFDVLGFYAQLTERLADKGF